MAPFKRTVAAGIIRNNQGEILICQRGAGGSCAFMYEFPGGKNEHGESLSDCLKRECMEELALEIKVGREAYVCEHRYPEIHVKLHFLLCQIASGAEPRALEHHSIRWILPSELAKYEFCPADTELIEKLRRGEIDLC